MQQIRNHEYSGIGAGPGHFSSGKPHLFPSSIQTLRHVRLFKKIRESDGFYVEQVGYHKVHSVNAFCDAMKKAVPYNASTIPGQCGKAYWGARAQQIVEQYSKYVPPMYVPDKFHISTTGCSGKVKEAVQQLTLSNFFRPLAAVEPIAALDPNTVTATVAMKKRKFGTEEDYSTIMEACPNSIAIRGNAIKVLADQMGFKYSQVKSAIGRLIKKSRLTEA